VKARLFVVAAGGLVSWLALSAQTPEPMYARKEKHPLKNTALLLISTISIVLFWACGDPQGGDDTVVFTYTPVPVRTFEGAPPVSVDERCAAFVADEVGVIVAPENAESFSAWLESIGFGEKQSTPHDNDVTFLVSVPAGSVPDAVRLIAGQEGVIVAEPNYLGTLPGETPIGERIFGCKEAEE